MLFWQYINLQTPLVNPKYLQIALAHEMRPYNAVSVSIPNLSLVLQSAARAGQSASAKDVIHFASKKNHLSPRSSPRTTCSPARGSLDVLTLFGTAMPGTANLDLGHLGDPGPAQTKFDHAS